MSIDHEYMQETVDIVDEYVSALVNHVDFYNVVCGLKIKDGRWDYDLVPYSLKQVYLYKYKSRVADVDKPKFKHLVKVAVNNYYSEEFGLRPAKILVKQKPVLDQTQDLIDSAKSKIRNVELKMNTLSKFENVVKAEVVLIHGTPVEELNEQDLINLIRKAKDEKAAIKDLIEDSKRMKEKYDTLSANIKIYSEALDSIND